METSYLFIVIPIFILIFIAFYRRLFSFTRATIVKTELDCLAIIEATQSPDARKNRLTQHEARARPNQALQRAFGIQNAFTMRNATDAKEFVREARALISASAVDWHDLSRALSSMVRDLDWALSDNDLSANGRTRVTLAPVVRALALKVSLSVLFKMREVVDDENRQLVGLGNIIHGSWMAMKSGSGKIADFKDNIILQVRLAAVFAKREIKMNVENIRGHRSNPLNLIIPGFETLWRVVLRLFIVLYDQEGYKHILLDFVQSPTPTQFKLELGQERISAEFVVKEALRLYPPTRRIRRLYQFVDSSSSETFAADVEAYQLDTAVWGADALQFKPDRWKKTSGAAGENRRLLAFGSRPFLCPASQDFGPMAIGLLVGVLLGVFGGNGVQWVLGSDNAVEMEELHSGERLRNERSSYEGVFLERAG